MTLVFCWLDRSFSRNCITSIADTRSAYQDGAGEWQLLNETTTKLFGLGVKCHTFDGLGLEHYRAPDPYFETEIGFAFAGYCFEALSIIALMRRCLSRLVQMDGNTEVRPTPEGYARLLDTIGTRYFASHRRREHHLVSFLMSGFSDQKPWVVEWSYRPQEGARHQVFDPITTDNFFAIGDAGKHKKTQETIDAMRKAISRHRSGLVKRFKEIDERKLEDARHVDAEKRLIERTALESLDDEFKQTVGGVLQKMEVKPMGDKAFVDFCKDDEADILDGLPMVGSNLGYIPLNESMGMGSQVQESNPEEAP
ncbi:hypothetical protein [Hyphomicrobium sp. ghe19]|uniref:hypothetical protein n=1 Tax=Hyphomicrobium sp. ghe19 TaxID=2682968 RepID=UPI001366BD60|nr:hypothetical protein HYPP_02991 [Hyphomicrobium sp. ghe19]